MPYSSLEHRSEFHENTVLVNWCLSNVCNYACSYCPDILHDHSTPWPELQTVLTFCEKLMQYYPNRKLYFEFTGGEVTLWKDFPALCEYIKKSNHFIGFISNASRRMEWWEKHHSQFDHVCLSFHSESADPEHFLKVAQYLAPKVRVHVNVMMKPENFDLCFDVGKRASTIPDVTVALQPLIVDFGDVLYNYTDAQKDILQNQYSHLPPFHFTRELLTFRGEMKKVNVDGSYKVTSAQELVSNKQNSWVGWECFIGKEQLVVDFDGSVKRGWCGVGGTIGNFKNLEIELPQTGITCNKEFCHCNLDIMCTKKKSTATAATN